MELKKIVALLHFIFVRSPIDMLQGCGYIILDNASIIDTHFCLKKIKNKKNRIDKQKFDKMMRRLTK